MQHQLSKDFYQYWESRRHVHGLPRLVEFTPAKLAEYDDCGFIFTLKNGDIVISHLGEKNRAVLSDDLVDRPITDLYPPALKAMQMALLMPCIQQKVGLLRRSRLWFGHRHKDVEWLFLPVYDQDNEEVAIVGLAVTFVERHEQDEVAVGSPMVERIITQNYLTQGKDFDPSAIDSHSWAVLDAMGARVRVSGHELQHDDRGIAGDAGLMAAKVARPNVLAVAQKQELGSVAERLGGRYNLRLVDTFEDARSILRSDMIDILVTTETVEDGCGLDLIHEAQSLSAFTACVMMLDRRAEAQDTRVEEDGSLVHCLVKPVGEFALRQALDDAGTHVDKARQRDAS